MITTYEGKHNHGVPKPRNGGNFATNQPPTSSNYSTNVHGIRELTTYNGQIPHILHSLENSKNYRLLENSYANQDSEKEKLLLTTKEEPENDFIFNSY